MRAHPSHQAGSPDRPAILLGSDAGGDDGEATREGTLEAFREFMAQAEERHQQREADAANMDVPDPRQPTELDANPEREERERQMVDGIDNLQLENESRNDPVMNIYRSRIPIRTLRFINEDELTASVSMIYGTSTMGRYHEGTGMRIEEVPSNEEQVLNDNEAQNGSISENNSARSRQTPQSNTTVLIRRPHSTWGNPYIPPENGPVHPQRVTGTEAEERFSPIPEQDPNNSTAQGNPEDSDASSFQSQLPFQWDEPEENEQDQNEQIHPPCPVCYHDEAKENAACWLPLRDDPYAPPCEPCRLEDKTADECQDTEGLLGPLDGPKPKRGGDSKTDGDGKGGGGDRGTAQGSLPQGPSNSRTRIISLFMREVSGA